MRSVVKELNAQHRYAAVASTLFHQFAKCARSPRHLSESQHTARAGNSLSRRSPLAISACPRLFSRVNLSGLRNASATSAQDRRELMAAKRCFPSDKTAADHVVRPRIDISPLYILLISYEYGQRTSEREMVESEASGTHGGVGYKRRRRRWKLRRLLNRSAALAEVGGDGTCAAVVRVAAAAPRAFPAAEARASTRGVPGGAVWDRWDTDGADGPDSWRRALVRGPPFRSRHDSLQQQQGRLADGNWAPAATIWHSGDS